MAKARLTRAVTLWMAFKDMAPLSLAVLPWGLLTGSLAIESGLSPLQAQCMSLLVFAGAAQLASLNLIVLASPLVAIFSTTFVISSRHLLYSAVYRGEALGLSRGRRYLLAFLLTDEMFVINEAFRKKYGYFDYLYAVAAGFVFYLAWNLATLCGIVLGGLLPDMSELGFDFAVAAIFIAMVVPSINSLPVLGAAVVAGVIAVGCELMGASYGILLAGVGGMATGFLLERWWGRDQ